MKIVNVGEKREGKLIYPPGCGVIYCGREWGGWKASPLGNPHGLRDWCPTCKDRGVLINHQRGHSISYFKEDLWRWIKEGREDVLNILVSLRDDAVLGCWCVNKDEREIVKGQEECHTEVIIRAARLIQSAVKATREGGCHSSSTDSQLREVLKKAGINCF